MNRQELADRRAFDLRVLSDMRCQTFDFEAYRTMADLEHRRSPVTDPEAGKEVTKYPLDLPGTDPRQPDQVRAGDRNRRQHRRGNYPRTPPGTWILSAHVPWSPHFMRNAPVCIGPELWAPTGGYITLGELAVNIAHLLNWDEAGRGPGYSGYNREAIEYHKKAYRGQPIDPGLRYPVLPGWLEPENRKPSRRFQVVGQNSRGNPGFRIH